ncbi:MAG: hypothetical protein Q9227_004527 [Pyrenula ochraceoflavens]
MAPELYQCNELSAGEFIRLFILQPGNGKEPLKCSIRTFSLEETPPFEAISYVWGNPERKNNILVDGHILKITDNLQEALRTIRHPEVTRTLWADSVCINQNSPKERGHQVSLMAQIYARASRTLIFINSRDDGHAERLESLLNEVDDMIQRILPTLDGSWNCFPFPEPNYPVLTDPRWESMRFLFEQEWFWRGWVVQEADLARDGRVIHHGIDARFLYGSEDMDDINVLSIMNCARSLHLKDPRDRIYAFQNLTTKNNKASIILEPNYEQSSLDSYMDFAQEYLRTSSGVDLLEYIRHDEDSILSPFASWVPRWNICSDEFYIAHTGMPQLTSQSALATAPVVLSKTLIRVRAVIFDVVCYISQLIDKNAATVKDIACIWDNVSQVQSHSPYAPDHQLLAFVQTLTCGRGMGDPQAWVRAQEAYMLLISQQSKETKNRDQKASNSEGEKGKTADFFHRQVQSCGHGRRIVVTKRGYYGLTPGIVHEGDLCCIVFGGRTPFILRETEKKDHYKILGQAFSPGKDISVRRGVRLFPLLGCESSKDWTEWDVEERDIYLC